jgi:hypothetical protein
MLNFHATRCETKRHFPVQYEDKNHKSNISVCGIMPMNSVKKANGAVASAKKPHAFAHSAQCVILWFEKYHTKKVCIKRHVNVVCRTCVSSCTCKKYQFLQGPFLCHCYNNTSFGTKIKCESVNSVQKVWKRTAFVCNHIVHLCWKICNLI